MRPTNTEALLSGISGWKVVKSMKNESVGNTSEDQVWDSSHYRHGKAITDIDEDISTGELGHTYVLAVHAWDDMYPAEGQMLHQENNRQNDIKIPPNNAHHDLDNCSRCQDTAVSQEGTNGHIVIKCHTHKMAESRKNLKWRKNNWVRYPGEVISWAFNHNMPRILCTHVVHNMSSAEANLERKKNMGSWRLWSTVMMWRRRPSRARALRNSDLDMLQHWDPN